MSRIHITRDHALGLVQARSLARRWAQTAEEHLGMACSYEEGENADQLDFNRTGVHGRLTVTEAQFVVDAKLGLLLRAFKHRIEAELVRNLDQLLAHEEPLAAFDAALARRTGARVTREA